MFSKTLKGNKTMLKKATVLILSLLLIIFAVGCDIEQKSETYGLISYDRGGDDDDTGDAENDDDSDEVGNKGCEKIPLDPVDMPDISTGPSVVTLDGDGFFVVNGVKFFPYGFYGYPTGTEEMAEWTEVGFNTTVSFGGCCQGGTLQSQIDKLNYLNSNGIMGAPHCLAPKSQYYSESPATITDWIDQRAQTGSLLFWYTYDEPGIWSIPKQETSDVYDTLKTLDPNHPNALVMPPGEEYTEYIDYTDFMMTDPYPSPLEPLALVKYALLEAAAASNYEKRVFGVPQAFDWYYNWGTAPPGHTWRPYVWEMRNMTYQMMVFGVNGMSYFVYSSVFSEAERWEGLKEIGTEVVELMPILLELDHSAVIEEIPDLEYVDHALREVDGVYYLMVVSTWGNSVTVKYDLSPLGLDLCVLNYFSEEVIAVDVDGMVTLNLPHHGEAVLQIIPQQ